MKKSKIPVLIFTIGEGVGYVWDGNILHYEMLGHWTQQTPVSGLRMWSAKKAAIRPIDPCQPIYPSGSAPTRSMRDKVDG
jgi:hypothetical protein